jgi:cytochrome c oxidase subunit II
VRRGTLVRLVAVGLAAAAAAFAVAFFVPWLPDSASEEADRIDFVFWFVSIICIVIFGVVAAVSVYAVLRFRVRPDDDTDGPPIHGHTGLEIVWTAIPAALVTAISIVSAVALAQNDHLPKNHLKVQVIAQQFAWTFKYPQYGNLTTTTLRLPIHRPVELMIRSLDVTHSFWVPEFGQKLDAVPGPKFNRLVVTPKREGTFDVVCTELCGLGHALMRSQTIVMSKSGFDRWAKGQRQQAGGGGQASGKNVFTSAGCGGCHTFKPAGANGNVGPDLDDLRAAAQRAGKPLQAFVRESIEKPNAYVAPGFQPNVMPQDFGERLSKPELDALVQYLLGSQK